jgi:nucleoside-diphosphate-sugar epimerase
MILVTGSTGLAGSHLLYSLLQKGYRVKALVRPDSRKENVLHTFGYYADETEAQNLFEKIEWVEGDVLDIVTLHDAFEGVSKVYHTAAMVSFNSRLRKKVFETNVEGTANIVNLCLEKNIEKLCFVSSIAALGSSENGELANEETLWKPVKKEAIYSLSKTKSEMEVWRGIAEGLNAVIVNPSVIIGPGQWAQGSSQFFTTIDKGLRFYTSGGTGVVDVRDVVRAMIELMESDISGERFVLSAQNIGYLDFFAQIAASIGKKAPDILANPFMTNIAWRADALRSMVTGSEPVMTRNAAVISHKMLKYSALKIQERLGFEFTPLSETISNTARCFLADKKEKK